MDQNGKPSKFGDWLGLNMIFQGFFGLIFQMGVNPKIGGFYPENGW